MKDEEFFAEYGKTFSKSQGIPGFEMNAPMTVNSHKGSIGLELEMEGANLPNDGQLDGIRGVDTKVSWACHNDGSLRNGREYVLSAPCTRKELPGMVDGLWKVFEAARTDVANSNRCSTHVHVNMAGNRVNTISSIIALWSTFEEVLIDWCGEERKTNHFCLSAQDTTGTVDAWNTFLETGEMPTKEGGLKYSALNILPLWGFGSLEFRCGPVPNDKDTPVTWAIFLDTFAKYVKEVYPNPNNIAYDLSERGGCEIFKAICARDEALAQFSEDVIRLAGGADMFNNKALIGFRNVQGICMGHPWAEWIALCEREFVPNPFKKAPKAKKNPRRIMGHDEWGDPIFAEGFPR